MVELCPCSQTCLQEEYVTEDKLIIKRILAEGDDTLFESRFKQAPQIGESLVLQFSVMLIDETQMIKERDKIVLEVLADLADQDSLLVSNKKLQLNFYS